MIAFAVTNPGQIGSPGGFFVAQIIVRVVYIFGFKELYQEKGRSPNWAVLVVFFGLVGAIPYLFLKKKEIPSDSCKSGAGMV